MPHNANLPQGFVYLYDIDPTIMQEVKYATLDNFMGMPARGYYKQVIIATCEVARAVANVQKDLSSFGLSLKVFDAYRPQSAIDHFWEWAADANDLKMKEQYYPNFNNKLDLFNGYIARLSAHSRGAAIDLTIVDLASGIELEMGGIFDLLDVVSNTAYPNISIQARINRVLLKSLMEKHGFKNYDKEWWHFNIVDEPFSRTPEDHFNFPIR